MTRHGRLSVVIPPTGSLDEQMAQLHGEFENLQQALDRLLEQVEKMSPLVSGITQLAVSNAALFMATADYDFKIN